MSADENDLTEAAVVQLLNTARADAGEPDTESLIRIRGLSEKAFATGSDAIGFRKRGGVHVYRWLSAAAAIVAVGVAIWAFTLVGPSQTYAMADVANRLQKARTLHWKTVDVYVNRNLSKSGPVLRTQTITRESWHDADRGFFRDRYKGTVTKEDGTIGDDVNNGESVSNDQLMTGIYHVNKRFYQSRVNPLMELARKRDQRNAMMRDFGLADPRDLASFRKSGVETINGITCDLWEGRFPQPSDGNRMVKLYVDPAGGIPRIIIRPEDPARQESSRTCTIDVLEVNAALPPDFFDPPKAPDGYIVETFDSDIPNSTPGQLSMGEFDTGVDIVDREFTLVQCFVLTDGALILCWTNDLPFPERLPPLKSPVGKLEFGGDLPLTPVTIASLRTNGVSQPEIEFTGRHLAATLGAHKRQFIWTLFVPEKPTPPREQFVGYTVSTRPHPKAPLPAWTKPRNGTPLPDDKRPISVGNDWTDTNDFAGGMKIDNEADFNMFVRGVMAQYSEDGKPPADVTYASVLELIRKVNPKLKAE